MTSDPVQRLTGGLVIADARGQLLNWNRVALRLHGFETLEQVRRHVSEFTDLFTLATPEGEHLTFDQWPLPRLMRGEEIDNLELRLERLDTGQVWFISYSGTVIHGPDGEVVNYVLMLQDVTHWTRAVDALRRGEETLHHLADAMPQIVWTADAEGHVDYYNKRWYEFTGTDPAAADRRDWLDAVHPDDQALCRSHWAHSLRTGQAFEFEYRFFDRASGDYHWQLGRALPDRDADGRLVRWFGTSTDIDDLKRAEAAVRASETRLRGVVETAVDGILTIDERGTIETVNPAVTRIFGYEPAEMIGQNIKMLMPQPYAREHDGYLERYRRTGERRIIGIGREVVGQRKDGSTFPLELSVGEMTVNGGRFFTGIVRDITLRKEADRRLRDKQMLLQTLVEGIPEPVFVKDVDGCYRYVNSAVAQLAGRTPAECVGQTDFELFGAELGRSTREIDQHIAASSEALTYEQTATFNGQPRVFLVSKTAYRDADGAVAGVLGLSRDITFLKRAEEALRNSAEHLRDVLDSLLVSVIVLSAEGAIREMNAAARDTLTALGVDSDAVRGQPLLTLPIFDTAAAARDAMAKAIATAVTGQAVRLINLEIGDETNPTALDVAIAPMRDADHDREAHADDAGAAPRPIQHVIISAVDVTERKIAEARARDQQAELAHLDRVQTMGHMAAGLAHELNQPLAAIVNYAAACRHMLIGGDVEATTIDMVLADIVQETSRAGEIIRRMRSFVRKQQLLPQPMDPQLLVLESMRILAFDLRQANVEPELRLTANLPFVLADPVQIQQVLVNLVRNALDSMADVPVEERRLAVGTELTAKGLVAINVYDTGKGVPAADIPRLFDAFYTTKKQGLGMGLALCRIIIEDHGGHIAARPNPDAPRGMHFSFTLRPDSAAREGDLNVSSNAIPPRADRLHR